MDDHVIDHLDGRHDEPPVEIEVSGPGTAAPSAFLVSEGDTVEAETIMLVEMVEPVADDFLGFFSIELFHGFSGRCDPFLFSDFPMKGYSQDVVLDFERRAFEVRRADIEDQRFTEIIESLPV